MFHKSAHTAWFELRHEERKQDFTNWEVVRDKKHRILHQFSFGNAIILEQHNFGLGNLRYLFGWLQVNIKALQKLGKNIYGWTVYEMLGGIYFEMLGGIYLKQTQEVARLSNVLCFNIHTILTILRLST